MKKIYNVGILYSLNQGKEDVLYESIEEIKENYPEISEDELIQIEDLFNHKGYKCLGFVKSERFTDLCPNFINVDDQDEYRKMLDVGGKSF